ncbi:SDR family oxidoreductase [Corynebacterium sp. YIM 101645]|uniref:SDR family oxidoreductase n=1 Tax=Corynebacterium lemuris TaxID=1859292 RepID=A0ABT2FU68_9CORY|nr:SDR family oxidoreductase [Corynebacterium lemuris]MCS5478783.1 SDR family oxidoreductase [Corynebacterium lemuris]
MQVSFDFKDKIVVITGGATGIGRATAVEFARAGATVVVGDIDDRAEETVQIITAAGGTAEFVRTDVTDDASVQNLVDTAVDKYGTIDIAFNNAGVLPPSAPLHEQTVKDWHRTMGVDATGVFLAMRHQIPVMLKAGGGSIVNTASVAGVTADPDMTPYVAAKHAVVGLSKGAALDYATEGIRINVLAPGLIRTPMTERWLDDPEIAPRVLADSPIGRAAEPEEVAATVLYLSSDMAGAVTGSVYRVDGGRTAH